MLNLSAMTSRGAAAGLLNHASRAFLLHRSTRIHLGTARIVMSTIGSALPPSA